MLQAPFSGGARLVLLMPYRLQNDEYFFEILGVEDVGENEGSQVFRINCVEYISFGVGGKGSPIGYFSARWMSVHL